MLKKYRKGTQYSVQITSKVVRADLPKFNNEKKFLTIEIPGVSLPQIRRWVHFD